MVRSTLLSFLILTCTFAGMAQSVPFGRTALDSLKLYRSLESALRSTEPVYRLELSKEKLKEIPKEVFQLSDLKELDLSKNKIEVIPNSINRLANLEVLNLEGNRIEHLPDSLSGLTQLRLLNIGENDLLSIPDHIESLKDLSHLIAWGNLIAYFSPNLGELEYLQELDLLLNDMTEEEQGGLLDRLSDKVVVHMSPPCRCDFDNTEEK